MPTTLEIQTALANEARRQELKQRIAGLRATSGASASLMQLLSRMNGDTAISLDSANDELAALEAGAGPGITADFGVKSSVTQMLEAEREAAKGAVVDYVKAHPSCSEEDSAAAWDAAALASHVDVPTVLQGALAMSMLYRLNLLVMGALGQNTWEAQRAWILATPKDDILAM